MVYFVKAKKYFVKAIKKPVWAVKYFVKAKKYFVKAKKYFVKAEKWPVIDVKYFLYSGPVWGVVAGWCNLENFHMKSGKSPVLFREFI